jgi:hypothetical protein
MTTARQSRRLEHRQLAPHERIALLLDVEEVLGVEVRQLASMLDLPRTTIGNVVGHARVELPVPTDDEQVVVGDGAEGLVLHNHTVQSGTH